MIKDLCLFFGGIALTTLGILIFIHRDIMDDLIEEALGNLPCFKRRRQLF